MVSHLKQVAVSSKDKFREEKIMRNLIEILSFIADCIAIIELILKILEALADWIERHWPVIAAKCEMITWRVPRFVI